MTGWGRIGYGLWHLWPLAWVDPAFSNEQYAASSCGLTVRVDLIWWREGRDPQEFNKKNERQVCAVCAGKEPQ